MFVEFSVRNFRSIKDLQTISFAASGLKSPDNFSRVDSDNIAVDDGMKLMKTIGVYGANGSGKSNIIRALEFFLEVVKLQASSDSNLGNLCDPFLYQNDSRDTESFFQIVVIIDGKKFRYGFTTMKNPKAPNIIPNANFSKEIITSEWLYGTKDKNSGEYFTRKRMEISKDKLQNKENIPELNYEHTLFLTHAAAFDKEGVCVLIKTYLGGWTISNFSGFDRFRNSTIRYVDQLDNKKNLLELLSAFNLKYDDITIEKDPNNPTGINLSQDKIIFSKYFNNSSNEKQLVKLNLKNNESSGTQKLFDIAGLLLIAFELTKGVLIILDEVDSNFHPSLLIKLIGLFNNPSINKNNSQLLFTSHDTNLMSPEVMRRDQFYFTEKKDDNSTRVYSLADLKGIRNDADFARDYLRGYYGALPVLGTYFENDLQESDGTLEH